MNEQQEARNAELTQEGQHPDKIHIRMGLDADTLEERGGHIIPLDYDRRKDENGVARYEVSVVVNGVLLAQVMITMPSAGPAVISILDADDLGQGPICPTCDAGDPTNPMPCECEPVAPDTRSFSFTEESQS